ESRPDRGASRGWSQYLGRSLLQALAGWRGQLGSRESADDAGRSRGTSRDRGIWKRCSSGLGGSARCKSGVELSDLLSPLHGWWPHLELGDAHDEPRRSINASTTGGTATRLRVSDL